MTENKAEYDLGLRFYLVIRFLRPDGIWIEFLIDVLNSSNSLRFYDIRFKTVFNNYKNMRLSFIQYSLRWRNYQTDIAILLVIQVIHKFIFK